ncbi:hypothetical protein KHC28_26535 [Ancylobacter sonchi]|uniref:hypothetical protein n=1 Tax=Ancylobacter sonchi TaxID=1937790 RepID=UPI001BD31DB0|nr:hypothetical protein [Ancylobacter sonchi]MBS7537210.1 hypothetical protein [Ancylobacter sonchi]
MTSSPKDISEVVKNVISSIAVVVSGFWILYQWDTIFPKTQADVHLAAATVRTDVSGTLTVTIGMEGSEISFVDPRASDEPRGVQDYCTENSSQVLLYRTPISGQITLKSASAIPVRARIERIRILVAPISEERMAVEASPSPRMTPLKMEEVGDLSDDQIFLGGLRENRVERGQEIKASFLFDAQVPVRCDQLERLMLFQTDIRLVAINPTTGLEFGEAVPKVLVTACQLNPRGGPACNVEGIAGYGQ